MSLDTKASGNESDSKRSQSHFLCSVCGFKSKYDYYGSKPGFYKSCVLLEDTYIMKDPFNDTQQSMMILGSHCSSCSKSVCASQDCSIFYAKRFCLPCVRENLEEFPSEIQQEVQKRKPKT